MHDALQEYACATHQVKSMIFKLELWLKTYKPSCYVIGSTTKKGKRPDYLRVMRNGKESIHS